MVATFQITERRVLSYHFLLLLGLSYGWKMRWGRFLSKAKLDDWQRAASCCPRATKWYWKDAACTGEMGWAFVIVFNPDCLVFASCNILYLNPLPHCKFCLPPSTFSCLVAWVPRSRPSVIIQTQLFFPTPPTPRKGLMKCSGGVVTGCEISPSLSHRPH